ncbi:uncharacterized protein LOC134286270 [Aedes albopictus]|uniref:Uncharacterized protein n=1 Tax=Aedes albopictus TaxID=7160 RepID=A0ABM1Z8D1_AEDAL
MPTTTRAAAKATAGGSQDICERCKTPHHVAEMVACDQCRRWYHRACAEVAESFNGKWTCKDCTSIVTISGASISGRTSSTSRSTRVQLQLMRLEEEKRAQEKLIQEQQEQDRILQEKARAAKAALDKRYLDEKYALLLADAEDDDAGSHRSRRSRSSRNSQVREWVQGLDEAAGGNPVPQHVEDIFPPFTIGSEVNVPVGGMLAKYTGAVRKLTPNPSVVGTSGGNQQHSTRPASDWLADNVGTEGMSTTAGMKNPITASTPIRMECVGRQPTARSMVQTQSSLYVQPVVTQPVYTQSVFAQPMQPPPIRPKLVPRPPLPTFLFQEPITRPSADNVRSSLPPISESPLLQSRVGQCTQLPSSNSAPQQLHASRTLVPPPSQPSQVVQSSIDASIQLAEQISSMQLPPTTRASFSQLSSRQPHTLASAMCDELVEQSQPPSVLRESISYTPQPQYPSAPERLASQSPEHQTSSPVPLQQQSEPYAAQLRQMQIQQSMWGQFQQQLSARQVVPKDLPMFTGCPEEWPLFISSFCNSTTMCGYSQAENLMRLQKCLKGRALEAVRSNLLLPSSVPKVMETLETLFGSPERLVQSLLNKVRSVPTPKAERLESLVNFGLVVQNLVGHLKAANQQAHLSNPTLLQELVDKLPPHLRLDWALYKRCTGVVDLGTFCDYMSAITSAASDVAHFTDFDGSCGVGNEKPRKEKAYINAHVSAEPRRIEQHGKKVDTQERPCYVCQSVKHRIRDCNKFKSMSFGDRMKAVETHQLCLVCLVPHGKWSCKSTRTCGIGDCAKKHHPALHPSQQSAAKPTTSDCSGARSKSDAIVNVHRWNHHTTIFRVVPVVLHGKEVKISTFAFLDEGSSSTLIDQELADMLNLEGKRQPLCLTWTSKVSRHEADSRMVSLRISGNEDSESFPLVDVSTVRQLDLPVQTLQYDKLSRRYKYLAGLPVKSYEAAIPRILIGLDNTKLSLPIKIREGQHGGPVAAKTRLGWTVFGSTDGTKVDFRSPVLHICKSTEETDLHDLVKGYFAMENLGVSIAEGPEAAADRRAKDILRRTTIKRADGHYETGLLWRYDLVELPSSYGMAERRLLCLERKLRSNPELKESLERQISEYQVKGYAHKATPQELANSDPHRTWYLPLGVVTNPRKPGKVRIIWDAAAKANGVSLNDVLLKGPDLLTSLPGVLCRFRQREVAIAGDIREMYHQLKIRKEDCQAQRFLYRSDPSQKPDVFVMDVATFGSTCSPCSANFVKNKNALEWKTEHPEASAAVIENHYVDDYLDSRDTEQDMANLASDVRKIQAEAGFELRNWRSNSKKVLQSLGEDAAIQMKEFRVDKESQVERVLGMAWLPDVDMFVYFVKMPDDIERSDSTKVATKRSILRFVMSVFDPLGLISNLLVHGKVIIQDLWRAKVGWDDTIPAEIQHNWLRWIEHLSKLEKLQIPRCYFSGYDPDSLHSLQLHIFVDASESAFACAAYFRIVDRDLPRCALVASKTKVAPLKPLSIPRLELQAAVIGSRIAKSVAEYHTLSVSRRFFWSDSKTVLSWIGSDARKYRQYVAVRIGEILEETQPDEWHWVPTKHNVADEATKWGKGPTFHPDSRWFTGPDFLFQPEDKWPQQQIPVADTEEELRVVHVHRAKIIEPFIDCDRLSKWERILRATAYVYSFIGRYRDFGKQGVSRTKRELTQEDMQRAEKALWRLAQADAYAEEITILQKESDGHRPLKLDRSSSIRQLSPFLDEFGVIRMAGRTEASPLASYDAKFPVILPKQHRVTELLIDWYHRRFGHHSNETVVNEIRQRYHISTLRIVVRKVTKKCQWCTVNKALPVVPRMAPLPEARVTPFVRPFSMVGIDYFGPYIIKIGRSHVKRWVALFTCLVVRAVHLEVAASLSTESCKLALRRFIARRGAPLQIYSDHGTNFVGASRELANQVASLNRELAETFTDINTRWLFIPPSSPHMGGAWERMVRAVKTAMESINHSRAPSEEVFQTILCEAESMVNSRPLMYIPLETSDKEALTPNHFILLSSNGVKQPEKISTTEGESLRTGWNLCRYVLDQFWVRWIREYLPVLTRRTKWHDETKPIREGDLVFVVGEPTRNRWPRGKVVKVIPGKDGRIRQADVQTSSGILRRPVVKLAVLNILPEGNSAAPEQHYGEEDVAGGVTPVGVAAKKLNRDVTELTDVPSTNSCASVGSEYMKCHDEN